MKIKSNSILSKRYASIRTRDICFVFIFRTGISYYKCKIILCLYLTYIVFYIKLINKYIVHNAIERYSIYIEYLYVIKCIVHFMLFWCIALRHHSYRLRIRSDSVVPTEQWYGNYSVYAKRNYTDNFSKMLKFF